MNLPLVVGSLAELGERESKPICLAIGMFDGVHRGHRAVLELAVNEARSLNGLAAVLTFPEHPAKFLRPGKEPPLLMDAETKTKSLLDAGADSVVLRTFDESFADVPYEDFIAYMKDNVTSLHCVCVGENFNFGKDRMGEADYLRKNGEHYGLKVYVADGILDGEEPISSSRIRKALAAGEIEEVNHMLGYSYHTCGTVVEGRGLGSGMGFPTLNIPFAPEARPAYGVYLVKVICPNLSEPKHAVANYGVRPTIEGVDVQPLLEVHLLGEDDFSSYKPGDELFVKMLRFLRLECKFDSLDSLKTQIAADKIEAEKLVLML
ncbi:MAG: riboflavin biosynthesis protein RibF [Opitutae bacterium]|nr:riboflavin biosynthesis protein RibF [Opitutae bacterium]